MRLNRRRILIVDREHQRRTIFAITIIPSLTLALAMLAMGILCRQLLVEAREMAVQLPSLSSLFLVFLVCIVVAEIVTLYQALLVSHKVSGPIVQFANVLKKVREGDASARIHLRKGDLVHNYADEINSFLDWLEQQSLQRAANDSGAAEASAVSEADQQERVGLR